MRDTEPHNTENSSLNTLHQTFIPSTPIINKQQCYGRFQEIIQISQALQEPGKHVLLFGGRGYGKTSVANIATHSLSGFFIVKINCHRSLNTFTEIWQDVFKKALSIFPESHKNLKFKKKAESYFQDGDKLLGRKSIGIVDIINFFKDVDFPVLVILDEADLITQEGEHLGIFADTIKALSDQLPLVKLLIIGIADNSHDFIGEHSSLERCLVEIKIDRMDERELMDILEGGLLKIGLQATPEVKKNIVLFSHGLPYYVHLLSLYAVEDALGLNYKLLVEKNFTVAVIRALESMNENLTRFLRGILGRASENYQNILNTAMVLEESALAEQYYLSRQDSHYQCNYEEIGFTVKDIGDHLQKKKQITLETQKIARIINLLTKPAKGVFIRNRDSNRDSNGDLKGIQYCFSSPLFRSYLRHRLYEATEVTKPVFFVS